MSLFVSTWYERDCIISLNHSRPICKSLFLNHLFAFTMQRWQKKYVISSMKHCLLRAQVQSLFFWVNIPTSGKVVLSWLLKALLLQDPWSASYIGWNKRVWNVMDPWQFRIGFKYLEKGHWETSRIQSYFLSFVFFSLFLCFSLVSCPSSSVTDPSARLVTGSWWLTKPPNLYSLFKSSTHQLLIQLSWTHSLRVLWR